MSFDTFISVFSGIAVTLAVIVMIFRKRSIPTYLLAIGAGLFWLGYGLAKFGPSNEVTAYTQPAPGRDAPIRQTVVQT